MAPRADENVRIVGVEHVPTTAIMLATARAQGAFASFLLRMESDAQADADVVALDSAVQPIVDAQIFSRDAMRHGCAIAYRKADTVLAGRKHDDNGLNREQIAAVNSYT